MQNALRPSLSFILLTVIGFALYLPGFFTIPPVDRDEARFAQSSKQMIETGNYLDIRFQGDVRYKKPIGIYWLQTAATRILGTPPYNQIWTYRIPSLLGAIASLWLMYLIGRTLVSPAVGFGAALLLASSLILPVEARLAKTDAMLLAMTLLAMWPLAKAYKNQTQSSWVDAGLFWLAIAVGILIKGPIILMVVGLAILSLCILQKSPKLFLQLRPVSGIAIVGLCVAPWLIAITLQSHGLFWQESVGHDMLGKVASGQEAHDLPPGTYVSLLLVLFSPAIIAVVRGLIYGWRNRADRVTQFLLAWLVPSWLIFEIVPTKLPHYTLPLYPAISLLAAIATSKLNFSDRRLRLAFAIPVAIAFALNVEVFGFVVPHLENFWLSRELQQTLASHHLQDRRLYVASYAEPSVVFLNGTRTQLFAEGTDAVDALVRDPRAVVAIASEEQTEFWDDQKQRHLRLTKIADINGFNLGKGRAENIKLYTEEP